MTAYKPRKGVLKEDCMEYRDAIKEAAKSNLKSDALERRAAEICKEYGVHSVANVMLAIDITRHPEHFDIYIGGLTKVNAPG